MSKAQEISNEELKALQEARNVLVRCVLVRCVLVRC